MSGKNSRRPSLLRGEKGSVMMEYVLLNLCFIFVLVLAGHFFIDGWDTGGAATYEVDPETGALITKGTTVQYGSLGAAFRARYDKTIQVISMPYP